MEVVLASRSPRRRELLGRIFSEFEVAPSEVDENLFDKSDPLRFALAAAEAKARDVGERRPDALVIAADTIVCLGKEIFGKPADRGEAETMLNRLSGQKHRVITGVALFRKAENRLVTGYETTSVTFRPLTPDEIHAYLARHEFLDKAGSYAVQEIGDAFVDKLDGDYDNVVGFPVRRLRRLLKEFKAPEATLLAEDFDPKHGWAFGRADGREAFLPGAVVGDEVRARLIGKKPRLFKIIETIRPSPWRVDAACPHFGTCGGCAFQNLDYGKQLALKEAHVRRTLAAAGIDPAAVVVEPILPSPELYGYRNKMEFAFAGRAGELVLGLRERARPGKPSRKKTVVLGRCPIFGPAAAAVFPLVLEDAGATGLAGYHPVSQEGFFRNLVLRETKGPRELMAVLVTKGGPLPQAAAWADRWMREAPNLRSVWRVENDRTADVVDFEGAERLAGSPFIEEELGGMRFRIHPPSFFQPNPRAAWLLIERIVAQVRAWGSRRVLGLYCGPGAIELFLSRTVERVRGIDASPAGIRNAEENARLNGVTNADFAVGFVENAVGAARADEYDLAVLDPPREGLRPQALAGIASLKIPRLIYMSCNLRTFVQDAAHLASSGYGLEKLLAADFFPHTPHFEVLGFLKRWGTL
ncbi:MAG: 23S rRNA (uracil(1939)-C(5))-methyltransferase RlmD [Candidatus Aminicenantes bacterium]|nr:23S rRNA (uracil(1939)-C(5))-methyltransferase RlmD [Candidatus Aminicenantes bacterium]